MHWEEKWNAMMSEREKDANIYHRLVEALSEICPKDVTEQMLMRRHEIGEKYKNLKAKVVSFATNRRTRTYRWRWTT